jgi:uncharacterized heparinase superfamily protein
MMCKNSFEKIRHLFQKPPRLIVELLFREINKQVERFGAPYREHSFYQNALLNATGFHDIRELWNRLGENSFPALVEPVNAEQFRQLCPGDLERILANAELAIQHQVDLLGSGLVNLGDRVNWHCDYKTGTYWKPAYFDDIDYLNPDQPSDVKFPWEVSRMQWLIPAGQAYLLTGDERYAMAVREVLEDWMISNPYAYSVNWSCAMEVALRIIAWTWFFQIFHNSLAWADADFRTRFLCNLYLHGDFTEHHLEYSDINGNHCLANAAGLVFAGLFFREGKAPKRWHQLGWKILNQELPRQVYQDGVDFEGSIPYHRFGLELFLLPALYRQARDLNIPDDYRDRLIAMAQFVTSYTRVDGSVPLWGDADDARVLPFGSQDINDHRYLIGLVGAAWKVPDLINAFSGPRVEIFWLLGPAAAKLLPDPNEPAIVLKSKAFPSGGFYIMRNNRDHIFIDGGPVGLAGRGGHGHNDCLSFEAFLGGVHLVSDCGAYVYTASYAERNRFRSTAYHNTPQVDGIEINRLIRPDYLWNLHYDAVPEVKRWETGSERDVFTGVHSGYQKLEQPLIPERSIQLDHFRHLLTVEDHFRGDGIHNITVPLHLAPGVAAMEVEPGILELSSGNKRFMLTWTGVCDWRMTIEVARVSPSYGRVVPALKLLWQRHGVCKPLTVSLEPV